MIINKTNLISNLKHILNQITPQEILEVDVFKVSMEIFCDILEEYCPVSIDIHEQFYDEELIEHFFKTYNQVVYDTLKGLNTNTQFLEENNKFIEEQGYDLMKLDLIRNPETFVSQEELKNFRNLYPSKGTEQGIKLIYEWVSRNSNQLKTPLNIEWVEPFHYEMSGGLSKIIYDYIVRIIQHPLGFAYSYSQIFGIELGNDFYWNKDNMFCLTSDVIDGVGSYNDPFWQNNNNPFLKSFTSDDFEEFKEFETQFRYVFNSLKLTIQDLNDFSISEYDLLKERDANFQETGNTVEIIGMQTLNKEFEKELILYLGNSNKYVLTTPHNSNYNNQFKYLDTNNNSLFNFDGYGVDIFQENFEYSIEDGTTTVLDYFDLQSFFELGDEYHRFYVDADIPPNFEIDDFYKTGNEPEKSSSAFDDKIYFIDYKDLDKQDKPLMFEWLEDGIEVDSNTPYNNDTNDATYPLALKKPFEDADKKDQYLDWDRPKRTPENYNTVFQPSHSDSKWFFSPIIYEPWQLFEQTPEEPNYGYWTHWDKRWKFIGQKSGRPISIGDPDIIIGDRGVRKYNNMPGFKKVTPNTSSQFYASSQSNLDIEREYWQPIVGNGQTQANHRTQYQTFLTALQNGEVTSLGFTGAGFLSFDESTGTFEIQPENGNIGVSCQTPVSFSSDTLTQNPTHTSENCDVLFYIDNSDPSNPTIIQQDTIQQEDWSSGDIYWFELPKPRISKTLSSDVHTFYRGIQPRQEEYNYMYFDVETGVEQDPVNLIYRTLEHFEIRSE